MNLEDDLPAASRVASAWQPSGGRAKLVALLALDDRLGRTVAQAREPLLAQVRLAWWRERLAEDASARPLGEPLLAAITASWGGAEAALAGLVDGWEAVVDPDEAGEAEFAALAEARGAALAAMAQGFGAPARLAGERWGYADLAASSTDQQVRSRLHELGRSLPLGERLPGALRGIAVLDALAARALARGGPLMGDRGAALLALRVGMIGR